MIEPTNEQLEKLKKLEVEMLRGFVETCEKLNLRYYVLYGTLLGAVRHKGFIPWDDDIDIGMPREDYEIFLAKAQDLLPKKYFLQDYKTDPAWTRCFAKIRDSETTFIESSVKDLKMNHGVYIDIFPLDFAPETKNRQKIFYYKNRIYNSLTSKNYCYKRKGWKQIQWVIFCIATCWYSSNRALKNREKFLRKLKQSSFYISPGGVWRMREIAPVEWYGAGCEVEFEGLKVKAPKEYDKWLTHVYGDYMKLPPKEKRVTHHYTEVIDVEKSYLEYIKE